MNADKIPMSIVMEQVLERRAARGGQRQKYDTCSVCEVTLPMGEEFDEHCCCGVGKGTHPECQRCNPDVEINTGRRV
jgi:hypothetical protein